MKRLFVALCVVSLAIPFFMTLSFASNNGNAKLALHVTSVGTAKTRCGATAVPTRCSGIVPYGATAGGQSYDVYIFLYDFTDTKAMEFGINYPQSATNGLQIWNWALCSALPNVLQIPLSGWPATGGGVALAFDCVTKPFTPDGDNDVVVLGYFYLTAWGAGPHRLSVTASPRHNMAEILDCAGYSVDISVSTPSSLGYADFGTTGGYKPGCGYVSVDETSWGKIKSLYR